MITRWSIREHQGLLRNYRRIIKSKARFHRILIEPNLIPIRSNLIIQKTFLSVQVTYKLPFSKEALTSIPQVFKTSRGHLFRNPFHYLQTNP
jgi:hypothetical protein